MPHVRPNPPQLATLDTKPSWHNRAGRIDRSACLELRASELWRHAQFPPLTRATIERPFRSTRPRRIASTTQPLGARFLRYLHHHRLPMQLRGDHRTRKSNAMKSWYANQPGRRASNPNKGATQLKWLALPLDTWEQTLTIQRWFFPLPPRFDKKRACMRPHYRLQHFLLCPRCNRKVAKLFLPLCTRDELRDAITAQQYADLLAIHPTTRNEPRTPEDAALVSRYHVLFNPRTLLCRTCLNLSYGEAKRTRK